MSKYTNGSSGVVGHFPSYETPSSRVTELWVSIQQRAPQERGASGWYTTTDGPSIRTVWA